VPRDASTPKRPPAEHTPVSVIILTKDEEPFIARCIESAGWADEVLVLDSGSADATRAIAAGCGAVVHEQDWLGWSDQRNKAISLASHDWVFVLECDEIVSPRLAASIQRATSAHMDPHDGYSVDRRGDFFGVLLPNPSRRSRREAFVRLFNRRCSGYDPSELIHEEVKVPGRRIPLDGVLLHWRGNAMHDYVDAFNRYATLEAEMLAKRGVRGTGAKLLYRPLLRFLWVYVYHRGFRFGTRGILWGGVKALAEFTRYAKLWEQQNARGTIHPPPEIYEQPGVRRDDDGAPESPAGQEDAGSGATSESTRS
jgi:(heptosyl)LPS beta-1,4-glucosyltransferase